MSLLLQALKKSEDERARQRQGLPIHMRALPVIIAQRSPAAIIAAFVFGGIALALAAWIFFTGRAPANHVAPAVQPAAQRAPSPTAPEPTITASANTATAPTTTPSHNSPFAPSEQPLSSAPAPAAPAPSSKPATPPAVAKPLAAAPINTASKSDTTASTSLIVNNNVRNQAFTNESIKKLATASAPVSTPGEILSLTELPAELRAELPALRLSGYIHAADASERLIAINDRLVHVDDEVAPGLRVQALTPSAVVFAYKGYRFRIAQ